MRRRAVEYNEILGRMKTTFINTYPFNIFAFVLQCVTITINANATLFKSFYLLIEV